MSSTSKVSIEVTANAVGVDRGVRQAIKSLNTFEATTRNIGRGVENAMAGVLASVSVGAFAASINSAIERIDNIGDLASGLADNVANISALQYAAERLGGSGDAVTSILSKMSKSIGTAAAEGGPAADAIKTLGLDISKLAEMQPSDAFISIADAISTIPNVYERARLGADIFGKGVTEINAVLKAGNGEMLAYMDRADALGITITESMAERGGAAKDAISDLRGVMGAVANTIATELSPEIVKVADNIQSMDKVLKGVAESTRVAIAIMKLAERPFKVFSGTEKIFFAPSGALVGGALADVGPRGYIDAYNSLVDEGLADIRDGIVGVTKPAEKAIENIESATRDMVVGYDIAAESIESGNERIVASSEGAAASVGKVQKSIEALQESAESRQAADNQRAIMGGTTPFDEFLASILQPVLDGQVYSDATKEVLDQWDEFGAKLERDVMTPMEEYQEQIENISDAYDLGVISIETYERATRKAWEEAQRAMDTESPGLGYSNIGMSGGLGGDMPFMGSAAYDRFMQYNTLPGGFVGDSIPANQRTFTPPEWGSRQVDYRSNYSDNMSAYGMDENNALLRGIRQDLKNVGVVA